MVQGQGPFWQHRTGINTAECCCSGIIREEAGKKIDTRSEVVVQVGEEEE